MDAHKKQKSVSPEKAGLELFAMATSFMKSRAICTAARLGLADLIQSGIQRIDELASQINAHPDALYRLMRALVSIGLFRETSDKKYELTPMSIILCESPMSLRHCLSMMGDPSWWGSWGCLDQSVTSGEPAIEKVLGMDYDRYLAENPEILGIFQNCLSVMARVNNPALLQSYDFSKYAKIVDIGGGHGELLFDILERYPQNQGFLYDLPHVIESIAQANIERCSFISGDFFDHVPRDGDIYVLKQILHDWNDEKALAILKNCQTAMNAHARLLIIETVLSDRIEPSQSMSYFFDLHMLLTSTGRERTVGEFESLLDQADLKIDNVFPTGTSFMIIECRKK